ncbi:MULTISPECIES: peptidylprolyl isomerase [unclassified Streptomyces]|uniref:peptidylprolyl isomerase n=1 Tax=unclassified Streptomyces TaxID=2593676 RepID=UPI00403C49E1
MQQELTATISTSLGQIIVNLFLEEARGPIIQFHTLASGTGSWVDPRTGSIGIGPLYDETIIHRVIDGVMIQGGDPMGDGTGDPGFTSPNDAHPRLTFERPYMLALAATQPNAIGSQFLITTRPAPDLNGLHTIIGEVTQGQDVVDTISQVPTDKDGRPRAEVVVHSIRTNRSPFEEDPHIDI